jgi:hypothetical protein
MRSRRRRKRILSDSSEGTEKYHEMLPVFKPATAAEYRTTT